MAQVMPTIGKRAKKRRSKQRLEKLRESLLRALQVLEELQAEGVTSIDNPNTLLRIEKQLAKLNQRPIPSP